MEITTDHKKIKIKGNILKIVDENEEEYDLLKLTKFGVERKFSRVLLILSILLAIYSIIMAGNLLYITATILVFITALILREESIILVFEENRILVLKNLKKKEISELTAILKNLFKKRKTY